MFTQFIGLDMATDYPFLMFVIFEAITSLFISDGMGQVTRYYVVRKIQSDKIL